MIAMRKIYTLVLFCTVMISASCSKFLDVKPVGIIIPEKTNDYELLLDDINITRSFYSSTIFTYDDISNVTFTPQTETSIDANLYFWKTYLDANSQSRPAAWADYYNNISNLNVILEGVLSATDGTPQKRKQIYAEALVARTFPYFHLLSLFAPAYDPQTATTDLGLPFVVSTDQNVALPERLTLKAHHDQLIADILTAIPDLPNQNINKTRITKNVAYGMLSRIYMSMRDYPNALKYAELVIAGGNAVLLNYNDYASSNDLPQTNVSPEELFLRYSTNSRYRFSTELLAKFDQSTDLRMKLFTVTDAGVVSFQNANYNPNRGITYAEIFLNKAECLARSGAVEEALDVLNNTIRINRIAAAAYEPLEARDQEDAINLILLERRKELAFKGLRWSDMRRLDKENRMQPVVRYAPNGTTVYESLTSGSGKYTFQIPLQTQLFNPNMKLNQR